MKMVKKKKKPNNGMRISFWFAQKDAFANSFKNIFKKRFFKSFVFDLSAFLLIILLLVAGWILINFVASQTFPELANLHELRVSGDVEGFNQEIAKYANVYNTMLLNSLLICLGVFLLVVFIISFFYGMSWLISLNRKFNVLFLKKYFFFNLAWLLFWIFLSILIPFIFSETILPYMMLLFLLCFFCYDFFVRSVFDERKRFLMSIKEFFTFLKKLHWFTLFVISSITISFILLSLLNFFKSHDWLFISFFVLLFVLFIGWCRNYIIAINHYLNKKSS